MNLAGTALKFTRRGRVDMDVRLDGEWLVYRVADTGIGIPKDEVENVFAEFRQVDAAITREYGGTGARVRTTKRPRARDRGAGSGGGGGPARGALVFSRSPP